MNRDEAAYRLLKNGLWLFLLGLFSGLAMLAVPAGFKNYRLALSSHLVGVASGMFLLLAGLLMPRMRLKSTLIAVAVWAALYGGYGNWAGTLLGAVFGTASLTAIAGHGFAGAPWQKLLVSVVLVTSGTGTIVSVLLMLWGLDRNALRAEDDSRNRD